MSINDTDEVISHVTSLEHSQTSRSISNAPGKGARGETRKKPRATVLRRLRATRCCNCPGHKFQIKNTSLLLPRAFVPALVNFATFRRVGRTQAGISAPHRFHINREIIQGPIRAAQVDGGGFVPDGETMISGRIYPAGNARASIL